jgi:hypothetical protein
MLVEANAGKPSNFPKVVFWIAEVGGTPAESLAGLLDDASSCGSQRGNGFVHELRPLDVHRKRLASKSRRGGLSVCSEGIDREQGEEGAVRTENRIRLAARGAFGPTEAPIKVPHYLEPSNADSDRGQSGRHVRHAIRSHRRTAERNKRGHRPTRQGLDELTDSPCLQNRASAAAAILSWRIELVQRLYAYFKLGTETIPYLKEDGTAVDPSTFG